MTSTPEISNQQDGEVHRSSSAGSTGSRFDDERVKEIRERRDALGLRHGDWPCMNVHNDREIEFQKHILEDIDYLLSLLPVQPAASPVLDFQVWAERWCKDNHRKLTQTEYGIAMAAFYAAHPGRGPISHVMPAASTEAQNEKEN